jgi:DedD protein
MDEALKARLVGATVLVALAVLLIPELLSGRKPAGADDAAPAASRGTRSFTIELGGGGSAPSSTPSPAPAPVATRAPAATAVSDGAPEPAAAGPATGTNTVAPGGGNAAGTAPAPGVAGASTAAAASAAAATQSAGAVQTQLAAPRPPVQATAQPPAASQGRGGWAVQVGAFGTVGAARKLADELQSAGYRAYLSPVSRSGKTLYRVRVGPEAERTRADGLAGSLKARGLPATVVANE